MKLSLFVLAVVLSLMIYASVIEWNDGIRDWRIAVAVQKAQAGDVSLTVPSVEEVKGQAVGEIRKALCMSVASVVGMIMIGSGWVWSCRSRRVARRVAEGLCVRCAYDLRGSASGVCPECGEVVKAHRH